MDQEESKFLFGDVESSRRKECVLSRLHLATRGVGDTTSLARALDEYRVSRRFITEGAKVLVKRSDTWSNSCRSPIHRDTIGVCNDRGSYCKITEDNVATAEDCGNQSKTRNNHNVTSEHCSSTSDDFTQSDQCSRISEPSPNIKDASSPSKKRIMSSAALAASSTFGQAYSEDNIHPCSPTNIEYIVVKCDPSGGYIGQDTVYYMDDSLPTLKRLDLLWSIESESHVNRCIQHFLGPRYTEVLTKEILMKQFKLYGPYRVKADLGKDVHIVGTVRRSIFLNSRQKSNDMMRKSETEPEINVETSTMVNELLKNMFESVLSEVLSSELRVFYRGQSLTIRDLKFFVSATSPSQKPGIVIPETLIYVGVDTVGECSSVSVAPLRDTLPTTYQYNLLKECVEPYFRCNRSRTFRVDDVFTFGGVQFRILSLEKRQEPVSLFSIELWMPFNRQERCGRVAARTEICVNDPVEPQLTDLLPPEQLCILRRCAPSQRDIMLLNFASQLDMDVMERLCLGQDHHNDAVTPMNMASLTETVRLSSSELANDSVEQFNITDAAAESDCQVDEIRDDICTVCWEMIQRDPSEKHFVYKCGHAFHTQCAKGWMKMCGNTCPNCRYRELEMASTEPEADGGGFHTLSDDDTEISAYQCGDNSPCDTSLSSASDLLLWLNSQEMD